MNNIDLIIIPIHIHYFLLFIFFHNYILNSSQIHNYNFHQLHNLAVKYQNILNIIYFLILYQLSFYYLLLVFYLNLLNSIVPAKPEVTNSLS